jgi:stage V sporulation protein D (sporulation-specific penicillin-binding protein)
MNRHEIRSPHNLLLKKRMEIVFIAMMLSFVALALRLVWIQGVKQQYFSAKADRMRRREIPSPARRGVIRDRNGFDLVTNVAATDVCANPRAVRDKAGVAARLVEMVGGTSEYYLQRLTREGSDGKPIRFVYLARGLDRKKGLMVQAAKLEGIEIREATKRVHPAGSLAAHILGTTDIDQRGQEAIEAGQQKHLGGKDGHIVAEVDATQKVIPDTEHEVVPPVDGRNVTLTIDANIQEFAEAELTNVMTAFHPEGATAIVMDVRNGDVLAMANAPTYDPNVRTQVIPANRRNRAITDLYEPGSVFKTITAISALEEGIPTSAYCSGSLNIGRRTIHCAHGAHGKVDLNRFIEASCNVTAATLAGRMGSQKLYNHIKALGFLDKTGIELIGETNGWLQKPDTWAPMKTANVGFGQGVVTTPLQMLRAYAAVANGGLLVKPSILRAIDGVQLPPRPAPKRVMSETTATRVREALELVVTGEHGTGHAAKIANYHVAGKTGTAQLARGGIYVPGAFTSSFVGIVPATRPKIAILVCVTNPHGQHYGGVVAAPAVREIARQTMAYLEVPPDSPGDTRDGTRVFAAWQRNGGKKPETRAAAAGNASNVSSVAE